jgi:DNA-binding NtrC family response regulator
VEAALFRPARAHHHRRSTDPCTRPSETIVVVDDEPEMRELVREALQSSGYIVIDTGDPQHAVRIVKEQPVHLLVTDVVMSLMKGPELADRVQTVSPSTKVLLMSGYHTADIAPSGRPARGRSAGCRPGRRT